MKIVFTGGGTGGHFYPIIAVVKELRNLVKEKKLIEPKLYYIGTKPFDSRALYENDMIFKRSPAGKIRRYFSIWNFFDIFKTSVGIMKTVFQIFLIYPDVIFSKGGYASFPTVFAGRILRIPIIIHESDSVPGRVNLWAGKFAQKIAVSYPETASFFKKDNTAFTGNPVRSDLYTLAREGAHEFLKLDNELKTIFIIGGSQGAKKINDTVIDALPFLIKKYQIIHQTGEKHIKDVKSTAKIVLENNEYSHRYKVFGYLNVLAMRMSAGVADLVISRAGSGAISEIAIWELPSIIIPISQRISHDQYKNAFAYARSGATVVIEEDNFTPNLLVSEIDRLMQDDELIEKMKRGARNFAKPDAARKIAEGIIATALKHEE